MPHDPFQGRSPNPAAPYDNALTITPSDIDDLPVIPSAILIPHMVPVYVDAEGNDTDTPSDDPAARWNRYPYDLDTIANRTAAPNFIALELANDARTEIAVPALTELSKADPLVIPIRPRRILRTGTTVSKITLLW